MKHPNKDIPTPKEVGGKHKVSSKISKRKRVNVKELDPHWWQEDLYYSSFWESITGKQYVKELTATFILNKDELNSIGGGDKIIINGDEWRVLQIEEVESNSHMRYYNVKIKFRQE